MASISKPCSRIDTAIALLSQKKHRNIDQLSLFIFDELEKLGHRSIYSIIPEKEIDAFLSSTKDLSQEEFSRQWYATFKERAIDYSHFRHYFDLLRETSFSTAKDLHKEKKIASRPSIPSALYCVAHGVGECGELSTYTLARILTIFKGHAAQFIFSNASNKRETHAFCVAFSTEKEVSYFNSFKDKKTKIEVFFSRLEKTPDAFLIDPLLRLASKSSEIKTAKAFHSCISNYGYDTFTLGALAEFNPEFLPIFIQDLETLNSKMPPRTLKTLPDEQSTAVLRELHKRTEYIQTTCMKTIQTFDPTRQWMNSGSRSLTLGPKEQLQPLLEQIQAKISELILPNKDKIACVESQKKPGLFSLTLEF